jgi:T5SS/PEP-CTERM-associated repeat protein
MNLALNLFGGSVLPLVSLILLTGFTLRAQVVADGATNTLNNVTNTIAGGVTVGTNGDFTLLILTNRASLTNSGDGVIGLNVGADRNAVRITDTNSNWLMANNLYVGSNGASSTLAISNGGTVRNGTGFLGYSATSTNNVAKVTGPGSMWHNAGDLFVGNSRGGNQLIVSNGASVQNQLGYLAFFPASSNNLAWITGIGSLWNNSGALYVGSSGSGNQLVVTNGAVVQNYGIGYLGANSAGNLAVVTGAGSLWSNRLNLIVGLSGAGNQLQVMDGGEVRDSIGSLGSTISSSNNVALVTGSGSTWNNSSTLYVGESGSGNRLVVSNGGVVNGGSYGYVGGNPVSGSSSNTALVTGPGSVWSMLTLLVGATGSGNLLVVSNGALVAVNGASANIGEGLASDCGAIVTGTGSLLTVGDTLTVGAGVSGQWLVVSNGGRIQNARGKLNRNGNLAVVTGAGSLWKNTTEFRVGDAGSGNRLRVDNGGTVGNNGIGALGYSLFSGTNTALITDPGSQWTNQNDLYIGASGSGNLLVVSNGAVVRSAAGLIGAFSGSSNNAAVVTGAGSLWTNASTLSVGGSGGSGNRLIISNSAAVFVGSSFTLGNSTNNRVVTDGGTLRVAGALQLLGGTNVLNAGTNEVDQLLMANAAGVFEFNGGVLNARTASVSNGVVLAVGNGNRAATYRMKGTAADRHNFAAGLLITNGALFTGNGTVVGAVTVRSGGTLAPGTSVGTMILSNSPVLQGTTLMEISKNGIARTNDLIQSAGPLTYGGSLVVSNLGPTALAAGDRFVLFSSTSYSGSFPSFTLPNLGAGLNWSNKLLVDGSIEVITWSGAKIGHPTLSGTNLIFIVTGGSPNGAYHVVTTTNIVTPLPTWLVASSGTFDWLGNATVTNGTGPGELQRYFRVRSP